MGGGLFLTLALALALTLTLTLPLTLTLTLTRWAAGEAACGDGSKGYPTSWAEAERGPETAGPMRQAFLGPFAIVVGGASDETAGAGGRAEAEVEAGDRPEMRATLAAIGALLANLFVLTSEASPPLLTDDEVVAQIEAGGGLF